MTTIKGAIWDRLRNDSLVTAIVGQQVYPSPAPRSADPPYISFQRISKQTEHHLLGPNTLARARFQINCWAQGPDEADELAEAVRRSLDGLMRQQMGAVFVDSIFFLDQRDTATDPSDGSETVEHVCMLDFRVSYREQLPAHVAAV